MIVSPNSNAMDTPTANKLNMYKAVETLCASHHTEWNGNRAFGSAFSRFAVKVAQLDLLIEDTARQTRERVIQLLHEIDQLLHHSIDKLVQFLRADHRDFYADYVAVRSRS